jgi:hypothetical protein
LEEGGTLLVGRIEKEAVVDAVEVGRSRGEVRRPVVVAVVDDEVAVVGREETELVENEPSVAVRSVVFTPCDGRPNELIAVDRPPTEER